MKNWFIGFPVGLNIENRIQQQLIPVFQNKNIYHRSDCFDFHCQLFAYFVAKFVAYVLWI